jgi:hypothetical protein
MAHYSSLRDALQNENVYESNNSTNKMQQFHKYYLTFVCGSTYFGRLPAHHQEHTTALGASGLTVGEQGLVRCWAWSARPRPTNRQPLVTNG